jgi:hypothetical protein
MGELTVMLLLRAATGDLAQRLLAGGKWNQRRQTEGFQRKLGLSKRVRVLDFSCRMGLFAPPWPRYWRAEVGGAAVDPQRGPGNTVAVAVTAGRHLASLCFGR